MERLVIVKGLNPSVRVPSQLKIARTKLANAVQSSHQNLGPLGGDARERDQKRKLIATTATIIITMVYARRLAPRSLTAIFAEDALPFRKISERNEL